VYKVFKRFIISLTACSSCLFSEDLTSKIYTHLFIHDTPSAILEAKNLLKIHPDSKELQFALIRALSERGEDVEAIKVWKKVSNEELDSKQKRNLLEILGWGVLKKSEDSSLQFVRLTSLIGAALTRDAKAIPVLLRHLRGTNALFRAVAVNLAANYGDAPLQEELLRLLKEEKVWYVRLEVIKASGRAPSVAVRAVLKEIIANPKTLAEEKSAALIALVSMYDSVDEEELKTLVKSNRAGLRQLGCEVVSALELKDKVGYVIPLLQDASPDVRISALSVLALMRLDSYKGKKVTALIENNLHDTNPAVALTAAYLCLILKAEKGELVFRKWIEDPREENRRLASGALAKTGVFGAKLAKEFLLKGKDSYVRVNLALGLIGIRENVNEACGVLYAALISEKETKWMWEHEHHFLFRSLAPSKVGFIEQVPNYPALVDQLTRLELLSLLSVMRHPKALDAVKDFLKHTSWGVSGAAAVTLLQEGDENAFLAVQDLLDDPDEKLRIQAALILAMIGSDPRAVGVLQEAYTHVDRDMKIHILEAIARIGAPESIPFLVNILEEPFQVLRVVAASALIQCLYH